MAVDHQAVVLNRPLEVVQPVVGAEELDVFIHTHVVPEGLSVGAVSNFAFHKPVPRR